RPYRVVGEVLFDVREAGHGLALDQRLAGTEPREAENGDAVTQRAGDLPGFIELDEFLLEADRTLEREHRPLSAGDDDGVEPLRVDLRRFLRRFDQRRKLRRRDEAHADQIAGRVSARVAWIAHRIGL